MKPSQVIEFRDPNDLRKHPASKSFPAPAKDSIEWNAFVDSIRDQGILQPHINTADGTVLDGLWRKLAARQLGLKEVPCIVRDQDDALEVILQSLLQRKHFTKNARAYLAYPLLEPVHKAAVKRRLENLKKGENPNVSPNSVSNRLRDTIEHFCEVLGFEQTLFRYAKQVHEIFAKSDKALALWEEQNPDGGKDRPADLRGEWEPKILDGRNTLANTVAGIAGQTATKGHDREDYGQLQLFTDAFDVLEKRFRYWEGFDEKAKNTVTPLVRRVIRSMPLELRKEIAKALKEADKEVL